MNKVILIICLLMLIYCLTGCSETPQLIRVHQVPDAENVIEISLWDNDGIDETGFGLVDPKKVKGSKDRDCIKSAIDVLYAIKTKDKYMSAVLNLLCFETKDKILCIDLNFEEPFFGAEYMDDGRLRQVLEKAGLMSVEYVPEN